MVITIHGDKRQEQRENAIRKFTKGEIPILIATDIASRGLDFPHVGFVINFDMPKNLEDYIHRIGRTGRCGNKGIALSLMNEGDKPIFHSLNDFLQKNDQDIPIWFETIYAWIKNSSTNNTTTNLNFNDSADSSKPQNPSLRNDNKTHNNITNKLFLGKKHYNNHNPRENSIINNQIYNIYSNNDCESNSYQEYACSYNHEFNLGNDQEIWQRGLNDTYSFQKNFYRNNNFKNNRYNYKYNNRAYNFRQTYFNNYINNLNESYNFIGETGRDNMINQTSFNHLEFPTEISRNITYDQLAFSENNEFQEMETPSHNNIYKDSTMNYNLNFNNNGDKILYKPLNNCMINYTTNNLPKEFLLEENNFHRNNKEEEKDVDEPTGNTWIGHTDN